MRIVLVAVGRLKKGFAVEGAGEYARRIGRYGQLEIREVTEERIPKGNRLTEGMKRQVMGREAARIREKMSGCRRWFALDRTGRRVDSPGFARLLEECRADGAMGFVVGGALGLDDQLRKNDLEALSFSDLTFPHDLFRVMLLEQIYRAWTLVSSHPYHK